MSGTMQHFRGLRARKTYDPATALSLAVACQLAYRPTDEIQAVVENIWNFSYLGFVHTRKLRDIDTQCFVMRRDEDLVVVFRGSDSINDWFANFQAVRDPGPLVDTRAHEGFQDALFPGVMPLTAIIDKVYTSSTRLWLSGHSLGGALCSLYAGMLLEHNYDVYGIYTFASPRPADDSFARQLNEKLSDGPHHRVVNVDDIVPHLPPEPFFSHPGTRMILEKAGHSTRKTDWTKLRQKIFQRLMEMTGQVWSIKENHGLDGPDGYVARLLAQVERE